MFPNLHKKSVPIPYFYGMNVFNRSLLLLLMAGFLAVGCDEPGNGGSRRHGKPDSSENSAFLRPDIFISGPNTLEGCVGLYTYESLNIAFDNLDVDKGRKIFATKTSAFAYLRMHNKDMVLHYDKAGSGKVDDKTTREVYRGGEYTAIIITHSLQEQGEAVWLAGTLEIIHGDKHFKVKVRGLSGC
jgi:hypothetical protein